MKTAPHPRTHQHGFTLVVIAALFVAFAVVAAAAIERQTTLQMVSRRAAAADQLSRLGMAILEYSVFKASGGYNLYPCPASFAISVDANTAGTIRFGAEKHTDNSGFTTVCSNTTGDSGGYLNDSSNIEILTGSTPANKVLRGMVPVAALSPYGITPNDAFDPWNNRIMYIVNRDLTYGVSTPAQSTALALVDKRTGYTMVSPDFILISYGPDGKGGHKKSKVSATSSVDCTNASSDVLREENCDDDARFFVSPTYTASSATTSTYFDDILTWYRQ